MPSLNFLNSLMKFIIVPLNSVFWSSSVFISLGLVGLGKRQDWLWLSFSYCLCFCNEIGASWTSLVDSVSFRDKAVWSRRKNLQGYWPRGWKWLRWKEVRWTEGLAWL